MKNDYKPIKPMKEIPDQLRKLRRQFLRYQQAEIVYSLSHKKLLELGCRGNLPLRQHGAYQPGDF